MRLKQQILWNFSPFWLDCQGLGECQARTLPFRRAFAAHCQNATMVLEIGQFDHSGERLVAQLACRQPSTRWGARGARLWTLNRFLLADR